MAFLSLVLLIYDMILLKSPGLLHSSAIVLSKSSVAINDSSMVFLLASKRPSSV